MSIRMITVNLDNVETERGTCTTCGLEFNNNDYVVVWKDCKHHMTCFLEIVENIDRDLGYINNEIIETGAIKLFIEECSRSKMDNTDKATLAYKNFPWIYSMCLKMYDFLEMGIDSEDGEPA